MSRYPSLGDFLLVASKEKSKKKRKKCDASLLSCDKTPTLKDLSSDIFKPQLEGDSCLRKFDFQNDSTQPPDCSEKWHAPSFNKLFDDNRKNPDGMTFHSSNDLSSFDSREKCSSWDSIQSDQKISCFDSKKVHAINKMDISEMSSERGRGRGRILQMKMNKVKRDARYCTTEENEPAHVQLLPVPGQTAIDNSWKNYPHAAPVAFQMEQFASDFPGFCYTEKNSDQYSLENSSKSTTSLCKKSQENDNLQLDDGRRLEKKEVLNQCTKGNMSTVKDDSLILEFEDDPKWCLEKEIKNIQDDQIPKSITTTINEELLESTSGQDQDWYGIVNTPKDSKVEEKFLDSKSNISDKPDDNYSQGLAIKKRSNAKDRKRPHIREQSLLLIKSLIRQIDSKSNKNEQSKRKKISDLGSSPLKVKENSFSSQKDSLSPQHDLIPAEENPVLSLKDDLTQKDFTLSLQESLLYHQDPTLSKQGSSSSEVPFMTPEYLNTMSKDKLLTPNDFLRPPVGRGRVLKLKMNDSNFRETHSPALPIIPIADQATSNQTEKGRLYVDPVVCQMNKFISKLPSPLGSMEPLDTGMAKDSPNLVNTLPSVKASPTGEEFKAIDQSLSDITLNELLSIDDFNSNIKGTGVANDASRAKTDIEEKLLHNDFKLNLSVSCDSEMFTVSSSLNQDFCNSNFNGFNETDVSVKSDNFIQIDENENSIDCDEKNRRPEILIQSPAKEKKEFPTALLLHNHFDSIPLDKLTPEAIMESFMDSDSDDAI